MLEKTRTAVLGEPEPPPARSKNWRRWLIDPVAVTPRVISMSVTILVLDIESSTVRSVPENEPSSRLFVVWSGDGEKVGVGAKGCAGGGRPRRDR